MLPFLLPYPADAGIAERFAYLANAVMVHVAARVKHAPSDWKGALIPLAFENLINGWIMRRRTRILALMARIAAGTQRRPVAYKPRADKPDVANEPPPRRLGFKPPVPFAWLCTLAQEVRGFGLGLARLVADVEMKAMLLAHPQLGRLMRPLMKMLGEPSPEWMAPPKRPRSKQARAARRQAVRAAAAEPDRDDPSRRLAVFVETIRAQQYAAAVAMGRPPPPSPPVPPPSPATEWLRVKWRGQTVRVIRPRWDL